MDDLSTIASLLGDSARATMLLRLMGGIALPAGELARAANVAPQTASGHLSRMVEGHLLSVERQGRHRYYRLQNAEVGDAIESLLRLTIRGDENTSPYKAVVGTLAHARTCYSHLAGWLGVAITEAMLCRGILSVTGDRTYLVTPAGREWLESVLSIEMPMSRVSNERVARRCLDWTERRHHLSGDLGRTVYRRLVELRWIAQLRGTRAVRVTMAGKGKLWDLLRIPPG